MECRTTVRYWAALKEAAGTGEEVVTGDTLADLLDAVRRDRLPQFDKVLAICSFLVDGQPVGRRDPGEVLLADADVVDCLPPYAGG